MGLYDGTLGAMFIGLLLATLLYGATCVQTSIYAHSERSQRDVRWLKYWVYGMFILDTAHEVLSTASAYRIMVNGFVNPDVILSPSPSGGHALAEDAGFIASTIIFFCQLFYARRIWTISIGADSGRLCWKKVAVTVTVVILANIAFAFSIVLGVLSYPITDRVYPWPEPVFLFSAPAMNILVSLAITFSMTYYLLNARTGTSRSDGALKLLALYTINTGFITAILQLACLITSITPRKLYINIAISIVLPKSYLNCVLAVVNSRDFLRDKMINGRWRTRDPPLTTSVIRRHPSLRHTDSTLFDAATSTIGGKRTKLNLNQSLPELVEP